MTAYITEPNGARWLVKPTGGAGDRAVWVLLVGGKSGARPGVVGFYARSVAQARGELAPSWPTLDGRPINPYFLGAQPPKLGEDY